MSKIIKSLKKREYIYLIVTFVFLVAQVWLDLKLPDYMSEITILVQTEGSTLSEILSTGSLMLACALGSLVFTFLTGFFAASIATTVSQRLRENVYKKTLSFSLADKANFSTGSLITRSTNDITQIQMFISLGYVAAIRAPLMVFWAVSKIASKNSTFTLVTVIAVSCLILVIAVLLGLTIPKSKTLQKLTDKLNTLTREHLTGVRVVRAYNAETFQEEKFEKANDVVSYTNTFINKTTAFMQPFMTFLMSSLTLAIYFVGSNLISDAEGMEKLTIFSDMVVFTNYAMQIVIAFMMLTFTLMLLPRVVVSLNRISEVIDFKNTIIDGKNENISNDSENALEFKNVSFKYPNCDDYIVHNLNFSIKKGQTVSIIGATGSGKSTIINLIPRFYDTTEGEILINGVNVKSYSQKTLREKISLVAQKALLFTGDIKSNVAFGVENNIDVNNVNQAVLTAEASDFVSKVGLEGHVSQGGLNLSGGQKQRTSIARAMYKKADIYLFDDCFSALDYKTDRNLRSNLQKFDFTKLIVAQRISTVQDSDQIIVLDDGKIASIGTHTELLNNCNIYREIAESQLSKEEIENGKK